MNLRLKIIFISIILHSSFFILHSSANAESISLAVDPPIFQINATPPANIKSPLVVENRGDSQITLKVSFKPFVASEEEDGLIKYVAENLPVDVTLTNENGQTVDELVLAPKEKKNLTLLINIPEDAKGSDYYFSILFLTKSGSSENLNSSKASAGISSNVLLSVGSEPAKGEISEFSTPLFIEKGPVPFKVRIKNKSNHFITPKGEILIKNLFGQTIGKVDLAQVNILAGSVRNVPSEDFFDEGKNLPDNLSAYWNERILIGPYKAILSIALSDTGPLFKRSILLFAFPLKESVAVLTGAILLIYVTIKVRSRI